MRLKIGRRFVCFLLGVQLVFLSGCTTELYDRMLIHAIGVDTTENGVKVTLRIAGTGKEEQEQVLSGEGESVYQALESVKLKTGRVPLYSHNYLVIFGRQCCEEGLDHVMDFFIRHFESRPSVRMFMAETTAEEVLSAKKEDELIPSSTLGDLAQGNVSSGAAVEVRVIDFVNGRNGPGGASCLPVLAAGEETVELTDTAVFRDGQLCTMLSPEETGGLLAVTGKLSGAVYVLQKKNAQVSLRIGDMKAEIAADPAVPLGVVVKISLEANIAAYDGTDPGERCSYEELSGSLAQMVDAQARDAVDKAIGNFGCDIFGFSARLCAKDTSLSQSLRKDPGLAGQIRMQCTVTAQVNHMGSEEAPLL